MSNSASASLPVADAVSARRAVVSEVRADWWTFSIIVLLSALAAGAGLVGPRLLGDIVDSVKSAHGHGYGQGHGGGAGVGGGSGSGSGIVATVDRFALIIVAFTVAQTVISRYARYVAARFGERAAARIRERFLERALALPASVVEHVPAGDLVARGTSDVASVAATLRTAAPDVLVAVVQALFLIGAVLFLNPLLGVCGLSCLAVISIAFRWYLRRARAAYLATAAAGSGLAEALTATASGARTVEALGLQQRQIAVTESAIETSYRAQMRTLWLRTVLYPTVDISYTLPVVGVLLIGGALYAHGAVTLGTVIASALYLRQLVGPFDVIMWLLEQLQQSGAAYTRLEGLAAAPQAQPSASAEPADDRIEVADVRYAYRSGHDVLHGVSLTVRPGERLALVGASGAGKSTLGRLLAGIDRPRTGTVTVGGVSIADLGPERLRRQVVLVTQEHHVFHDTLRDNLLLAKQDATDEQLRDALAAVDAEWAGELPDGLDTLLGASGHHLDGAEAQQLALARVVLADPHTLILDEATALLDPATARNTERALAAVLEGRTVVAIAHRLQTAHDADRVAVMDAGAVTELGTHDDLVAADGAYAELWHSWHGDDRDGRDVR